MEGNREVTRLCKFIGANFLKICHVVRHWWIVVSQLLPPQTKRSAEFLVKIQIFLKFLVQEPRMD